MPVPTQISISGASVKIGIICEVITKGNNVLSTMSDQDIAIDSENAKPSETNKPITISRNVICAWVYSNSLVLNSSTNI
jgi:hypothetical protein